MTLKGSALPSTCFFSESTMRGWKSCTVISLHLIEMALTLSIAFYTPATEHPCRTKLLTYWVPSWWLSSCIFNFCTTAECLAEVKINCFKSSVVLVLLILPLNLLILSLSLSTNGESWAKLCFIFFHSCQQFFGNVFTTNRLQDQKLSFLSFQCCHYPTLFWFQNKTVNIHSNACFVFANSWPIFDAFGCNCHQNNVVIIN